MSATPCRANFLENLSPAARTLGQTSRGPHKTSNLITLTSSSAPPSSPLASIFLQALHPAGRRLVVPCISSSVVPATALLKALLQRVLLFYTQAIASSCRPHSRRITCHPLLSPRTNWRKLCRTRVARKREPMRSDKHPDKRTLQVGVVLSRVRDNEKRARRASPAHACVEREEEGRLCVSVCYF